MFWHCKARKSWRDVRPPCSHDQTIHWWLTLCRLRGSRACWIKYNCPATMRKLLAASDRQKCLCAAASAPWGKPLSSVLWICGGWPVRQAFGIPARAQLGETDTGCLLSRWKAYEFLMRCIVPYVGDRLRDPWGSVRMWEGHSNWTTVLKKTAKHICFGNVL